jgi:hypothetical protein
MIEMWLVASGEADECDSTGLEDWALRRGEAVSPAVLGDDRNQPAFRGVKMPFLTRLGVRRGIQGGHHKSHFSCSGVSGRRRYRRLRDSQGDDAEASRAAAPPACEQRDHAGQQREDLLRPGG